MARQPLPPDQARRFRSGRDCIDFAHTGGEGPYARWEIIHADGDLAHWLGYLLGSPQIVASAADLAPARRLRAAIWNLACAHVASMPAGADDLAALNAHAAMPPLGRALGADGRAAVAGGTAAEALATIARDAVDLLSGPLAGRIRACAADDCGLLFVDASRPGRRRWCSMERCGNRAKARRHRGRDRQAPAPGLTGAPTAHGSPDPPVLRPPGR